MFDGYRQILSTQTYLLIYAAGFTKWCLSLETNFKPLLPKLPFWVFLLASLQTCPKPSTPCYESFNMDHLQKWHTISLHHVHFEGPPTPEEKHINFTPPDISDRFRSDRFRSARVEKWLWVKTNGIPFWLVGEFTTHSRTYFSAWIGIFTGGQRFGF